MCLFRFQFILVMRRIFENVIFSVRVDLKDQSFRDILLFN